MIRLMLATYSEKERLKLAELLENARASILMNKPSYCDAPDCRTCDYRHLCTDLMSSAVFAAEYKEHSK